MIQSDMGLNCLLLINFSVFQIRRGNRNKFGIIIHIFFHKNIFCGPSLELSHQEGSNEGSQHTFLLRNKKTYFRIILNTPSHLEL